MQNQDGKLDQHSLKSGGEARGKRLVHTVADAALDCGEHMLSMEKDGDPFRS